MQNDGEKKLFECNSNTLTSLYDSILNNFHSVHDENKGVLMFPEAFHFRCYSFVQYLQLVKIFKLALIYGFCLAMNHIV